MKDYKALQNGDGWFLLRKSLHDSLMPLNIESNRKGSVAIIAKKVKALAGGNGSGRVQR